MIGTRNSFASLALELLCRVYTCATCCADEQLVAGNKLLVARNLMRWCKRGFSLSLLVKLLDLQYIYIYIYIHRVSEKRSQYTFPHIFSKRGTILTIFAVLMPQ